MALRTVILAFALSLFCLATRADDLPPLTQEQSAIIRSVIAAGGTLTKEKHDQLWANITKPSPEEYKKFQDFMDRSILRGVKFQYYLWQSAKLSYINQVEVHVAEYDSLKNEVARYADMTHTREQAFRSFQNADLLLKAAANHSSIETPEGEVQVTPELADTVINNLDGSLIRAKKLFDPFWSGD